MVLVIYNFLGYFGHHRVVSTRLLCGSLGRELLGIAWKPTDLPPGGGVGGRGILYKVLKLVPYPVVMLAAMRTTGNKLMVLDNHELGRKLVLCTSYIK